jgi:hypothetical protein
MMLDVMQLLFRRSLHYMRASGHEELPVRMAAERAFAELAMGNPRACLTAACASAPPRPREPDAGRRPALHETGRR